MVSPLDKTRPASAASEFGQLACGFQSGALVSVVKKDLRKHFTSLFKFSWSGGSPFNGGSLHLSLVLRNGSIGAGQAASGQVAVMETCDGVTGVSNAVAVVLDIDEKSSRISLRVGDKSGATAALDCATLERRPLPDAPHWLLVEVRAPSPLCHACASRFSRGLVCLCRQYDTSNAMAPTIRVYLDDPHKRAPPILSTLVAIRKVIPQFCAREPANTTDKRQAHFIYFALASSLFVTRCSPWTRVMVIPRP